MALIRSASIGIPCAAPVELRLGCLFEPAQLSRRGAFRGRRLSSNPVVCSNRRGYSGALRPE
jgi:hypothetical protein